MKILYYSILFLFTINCTSITSVKNKSKVKIEIKYSKSADIFDIMDNVSGWWEGFTEAEYQKYWTNRFGLSQEDKSLFKSYQKTRWKYYNDPDQKQQNPINNRNGLFATLGSITADPIAEAFYSSKTLAESFIKLKTIMAEEDLKFFIGFYKVFESRYQKLTAESEKGFNIAIEKVRKSFNKNGLKDYFSKVANFYNVKTPLTYRVLYIWWPPLNRTNASPTGKNLIMRYNPKLHGHYNDSDIIAHEIIHTISANQDLQQKKKLTTQFLKVCPESKSLKKRKRLEEPLAVVFGQLIFNKRFFPERFSTTSNLYRSKWITSMARVIYLPLLERFKSGETINDGFIKDAALLCRDLTASASELSKK